MKKFLVILFLFLSTPASVEAVSDCSKVPFDELFNPESKLFENHPNADPETAAGRQQIALKIRTAKITSEIVCAVGFKCDTVSDVMAERRTGIEGTTLWCNQRSLVYFVEEAGDTGEITCIKGACRGKHRTFKE